VLSALDAILIADGLQLGRVNHRDRTRPARRDGAQQLLFGEFAPDEPLDVATRGGGRRKPFQAKVGKGVPRGFATPRLIRSANTISAKLPVGGTFP
jgi:hypothetical protein